MTIVQLDAAALDFMRAPSSTDTARFLVQVNISDLEQPAQIDSSKVGQMAPGGHVHMPVVQRSVHDTPPARQRVFELFNRLRDAAIEGEPKQALFASGLDVALTPAQLSVVASWQDLVGRVSTSSARYVLTPVPMHWHHPMPRAC